MWGVRRGAGSKGAAVVALATRNMTSQDKTKCTLCAISCVHSGAPQSRLAIVPVSLCTTTTTTTTSSDVAAFEGAVAAAAETGGAVQVRRVEEVGRVAGGAS